MARCASCGALRSTEAGPCVLCGAASPVPRRAAEEEDLVALLRHDETIPTARPITAETGTGIRVAIRPRLELPSVPGKTDPAIHVLVDIAPEGPPYLDPAQGPVAHVILLLDVSASMNHPDKYPVLVEALRGMLEELASPRSADVLLSLVVFAYGAKTLFRDRSARSLDASSVLAMIDESPKLFGRYTDVAGALERAGRIALAQLQAKKSMPIRVCLLTDGKPQDDAKARRTLAHISTLPIDIDAFAFGSDADVEKLQALVSGGRGGTVKQVRSDNLAEAFDRVAEVAQRIVSNRALLDFTLARGVVGRAAYRYRPGRHRFGEAAFDADGHFATDLGTLESGRVYSMLFEVRLPETAADRTEIGRIVLRLRGPQGPRVFEALVSIPREDTDGGVEGDSEVAAARDILVALSGTDAQVQLRALRVRKKLYVAERRDPALIAVISKAIQSLEKEGSLTALSAVEFATLRSHTLTAGGSRPTAARPDYATQ